VSVGRTVRLWNGGLWRKCLGSKEGFRPKSGLAGKRKTMANCETERVRQEALPELLGGDEKIGRLPRLQQVGSTNGVPITEAFY